MEELPLVSVVIPVYNGDRYVEGCLKSVLSNDYDNIEVIVVDDGSTDSTPAILETYSKRIVIIRKDNTGIVDSLNIGIEYSKGEFICRLDADDEMSSNRISRQVKFLSNNVNVGVVGSAARLINEQSEVLGYTNPVTCSRAISNMLNRGLNPLMHPSVMFRKSIWSAAGGYKSFQPLEDILFYIEAQRITKLANIPEILTTYRLNTQSISSGIRREDSKELKEYLMANINDLNNPMIINTFKLRYQKATELFEENSRAFGRSLNSGALRWIERNIKNIYYGVLAKYY